MATIKYNGMEIQSITECKVYEKPQEMLVWKTSYEGPIKKMVCAIIPYRHAGSVITTSGAFEYCAEIPEKPEPRRATNFEFSRWLAQGNGQLHTNSNGGMLDIAMIYDDLDDNYPVREGLKARKWGDKEWHEPTIDYLGIKEEK